MWKHLRWTLPTLLLLAALGWWVVPRWVPLPASLLTPRMPSVIYLARDGRPLRMLLTAEGDRLQNLVPIKDIPPALVYATLAAEDKRFGEHHGLDLLAIARALRDNLTRGRIVSGASTIQQQLIKVAAARPGKRTLWVKIVEAFQARHLAMVWDREAVMQEYLHRISYGNLLTGCSAAASGYFNKPLNDLTPAECALLAAIPQSPNRFNPFTHLDAVIPRQQFILKRMKELDWLTAEELRVALAEPLHLQRFTGGFAAPHAIEMLRAQGEAPAASESRSRPFIRTTLNSSLQRELEAIISNRLAALKDRHVTQAAAVVIENATGYIQALVGSRDFFASDAGQINGAWTPHSPGSAIKPFTYVLAFQRGATPASIVADLPIEFPTPTGTYLPENYAHRLYGAMTYRDALGNSLNISAVKVLGTIGGPETLLTKLRSLGLTTLTEDAEHYGLGLTIGNAPVRLIELANAYACLARLGEYKPWTLRAATPPLPVESVRQLNERECFLIADILSDNQARLLTFGANSPLRLPFRVAVKTGTSQSYRDNWTLGYTPEYTVGVWAGNFDNTPMQDVSGVTGAAPIWRDIFQYLNDHEKQTWYPTPAGLVRKRIDPRTGKYLTPQIKPPRISREEWFLEDRLPPIATDADYDSHGRVILPPEYAAWIHSSDNWMGDLVTTPANSGDSSHWRISSPTPGTVIRLDPDIKEGGRKLLLKVDPPREVEWSCSTMPIQMDDNRPFVLLTPGRHEITAHDPKTNEDQKSFIIVRAE